MILKLLVMYINYHLQPNDLRDNAPFGMMATSLDKCIELHASSGTTGIPVSVYYTPNDIDAWSTLMICKNIKRKYDDIVGCK